MSESIIDLIGKTPIIQLKMKKKNQSSIYAKLEMYNPFGMKDRVAKEMILEAKRTGMLSEGAPIFESSSGTLALGIALVGTYLGHPVHIITDPRIDNLTYSKLLSLGAKVHVVERMAKKGGWQQARLNYIQDLLSRHPDAYWPKQYENPHNPQSYNKMAEDIIDEIEHVDILVGAVGSGGSLCGTGKRLKSYNPNLKVVAVDAAGSAIFQQKDRPQRLQSGLGNSIQPHNVDYSVIDEVHWLNDEEAFNWTLELAKNEKVFAGNSSGSVYAVATWLSTQFKDQNIVCIFPDRGDRYFKTIYGDSYYEENQLTRGNLNSSPLKIETLQDIYTWSYIDFNKGKCLNEKASIY